MKIATLLILPLFLFPSIRPVESDCLRWIHDSGYMTGYEAMLENIRDRRRLTMPCREFANAEIREAIDRLVKARRLTRPHPDMEYPFVAQFRWFNAVPDGTGASTSSGGGGSLQEGMYVFYQPLFDLAMQGWLTNVSVEKGGNILTATDVEFDKSVVGYRCYIAGFDGDESPVIVIAFIDSHHVLLNQKTNTAVKGYGADIVPPYYDMNLCNCRL